MSFVGRPWRGRKNPRRASRIGHFVEAAGRPAGRVAARPFESAANCIFLLDFANAGRRLAPPAGRFESLRAGE
ncbi:hypothetical protein C5689_05255 [Methylosinus sporium]|uniref:Uncharacterized protein n=1 Tax=Methylosinus sporium TaxID=428 RepID=A0A2U1STA6_METSR|nr:hypothetical protein C5689_05255 [Methylosinus sporium]